MKLFHNFVTYFNVIWVICGEITYTSNIYEIDAAKINSKVFSKHNFLLILKFVEYGHLHNIQILLTLSLFNGI